MTQEMAGTRWSDARSLLAQAPAGPVVDDARPKADADSWEATRPLTVVDTSWVEGEGTGPAAPPRGLRRRASLVAASVLECKQVDARAGRHAIADLTDLVADRLLDALPGAQRLDPARAGGGEQQPVPPGTVLVLVPRGSRLAARLAEAVGAIAAEPLALAGRELRLTPVIGHSSVRDDERPAAIGRALVAMRAAAAAARRHGWAAPVAWTRELGRPTAAPVAPAEPATPAALAPPAAAPAPAKPAAGPPPAKPAAAPTAVKPAAAPAANPARPARTPAPASSAPVSPAVGSPAVGPSAANGGHEPTPSTGATRSAKSGLSFGKRSSGRHAVR